jgi:hypothetical protein
MSESRPTSSRSATVKAPLRRARMARELPPEYEGLIAVLEEAGATLPSASRISRMDTAMGYLALIPQDRYLLRRIVGCRALVHPISGRHLYSWRRLAELLRADHKAIQRWHAEGIRIIIFALRRIAAGEKMAQTERKPRIAEMPRTTAAGPQHCLTAFGRAGSSTALPKETAPP